MTVDLIIDVNAAAGRAWFTMHERRGPAACTVGVLLALAEMLPTVGQPCSVTLAGTHGGPGTNRWPAAPLEALCATTDMVWHHDDDRTAALVDVAAARRRPVLVSPDVAAWQIAGAPTWRVGDAGVARQPDSDGPEAWALTAADRIGLATARQLLSRHGTAAAALADADGPTGRRLREHEPAIRERLNYVAGLRRPAAVPTAPQHRLARTMNAVADVPDMQRLLDRRARQAAADGTQALHAPADRDPERAGSGATAAPTLFDGSELP